MPSQVVEEPLYTQQLNDLRVDWRRLDAAFISLEHVLLKAPETFPTIPGSRLQRLKLVGFTDVPPLSIFFYVEGPRVHLVSAELIDVEV
jgi:hypothetical protein